MSCRRVLIVEDSPTQAGRLAASLAANGFDVSVASSGGEGLLAARERRPDIVVSDVVMPGLDGYGMCRQIKADEGLRDTPVMLLTSLSDPQDVIRGLECGADGFVVKTDADEPILEGIVRLLDAQEREARLRDPLAIHVRHAGQDCRIEALPQRVFDFLISTYETAHRTNAELVRARNELTGLTVQLETRVQERTEELARKNRELSATSQQLWHAARLVTVGELAASIAHEINNPLQTVGLHLEALSQRFAGDTHALEVLSIMERELDRMARLVGEVLQLSRKGEERMVALDVVEELERTLELLQYHLRKLGIEVKREYAPDTASVRADPEQLRQVFLNLFTNACDAMPSGGTLTLRVRGASPIIIEVIDTGCGIPPEDLSRVMEGFFTTKPPGKGTGLGLPICRRILEAHGGTIGVESERGRGTVVRLTLPSRGESEGTHERG